MKKIAFTSILIVSAALLSACGGKSSNGIVGINLTDAPACGYDHVYVTIDHIDLSSDNGNTWTSIPVDASLSHIDLLSLQNGVMQQLAQQPLAAGTYNRVRLVLKANDKTAPWANSVVMSGSKTETPLSTPSGQQSGYKIKGPFTVHAGASPSDLTLDFNACKSVVIARNSGKYNLKPVVRAMPQDASGSIIGTTMAGATVYAEQNGQEITGTVADSSGSFTLTPLQQSSTNGSIDVVIVPPTSAGEMTAIIQNVPVTAGTATSIGTITPDHTTMNTVSGSVNTSAGAINATMTVSQTVSTPLSTYLIVSKQETTGAYNFSLAATGPEVGNYSSALPISLTEDTNSADAGQYAVTATDAAGGTNTQAVDVSSGSANADFMLTP